MVHLQLKYKIVKSTTKHSIKFKYCKNLDLSEISTSFSFELPVDFIPKLPFVPSLFVEVVTSTLKYSIHTTRTTTNHLGNALMYIQIEFWVSTNFLF